MTDDRLELVNRTFDECSVFCRDTTLADGVLDRYQVGLFLREPTFCDATYKLGGFVAPHRFLIISSNARCLDPIAPNPWGLCIWQTGRVFKIIDRIRQAACEQLTLLEVPEDLLDFFCSTELNILEQSLAAQARETFAQSLAMTPLPELNTDDWRDRLTWPIGINDRGSYFPLFGDEALQDKERASLIQKVLHYQARVHLARSDFSEALPLLRRALAASRTAENDGDATGRILLSLADLYSAIGDVKTAEASLVDAFRAFKELPQKENRRAVAATHTRLGHIYQQGGALLEAELNYRHALKIVRALDGPDASPVLLVSLGVLYEKMAKYDAAQTFLDHALKIETDENGQCSDRVLLNNLARLAHARGEHTVAIGYLRGVLDLERDTPAANLQQHAALLYNLAESLGALGRADEAIESFKQALDIDHALIGEVMAIGSDRQCQEFLAQARFRISQCISLILSDLRQSQPALEFATKLIFERKALALDLSARRREILLHDRESSLATKFRELQTIRSRIALATLANPGQSLSQDPDSSIEEDIAHCELIESELSHDLPSYEVEQRLASSGWRDVLDALPEETVLVEFFRLEVFDFTAVRAQGETPQGAYKYIAVILAHSRTGPDIVDLGDAEKIDSAIAELRLRITGDAEPNDRTGPAQPAEASRALRYAASEAKSTGECGEALRALVFDPLVSTLGKSVRIIVSPDGSLWRLPFGILPLTDGTCLIDRYEISYVTSGYDLLRLSNAMGVAPGCPLVIADPDFDLQDEGVAATAAPSAIRLFSRLRGTAEEGKAVATMLGVGLCSGTAAVEAAIKGSRAPAILHLATHGFVLEYQSQYLSPEDYAESATMTSVGPLIAVRASEDILGHSALNLVENTIGDAAQNSFIGVTPARFMAAEGAADFARLSGKGLDNPMLRSGVALAGANTWLQGGQLPDVNEDGILTADEVSGLNLAGTELVVLSACETGLGDIMSGEGVFGLRRSFVLAGARSLVISLWKVPDRETKDLMIEFYTRLLAGEARSKALRNAQLALKGRNAEPFYWGAFVCQGDASPLTQKFLQT